MKLVEENLSLETQDIQQEHVFGVADMGMIFDILRNKMYSDKIAAICREITCNARDSHREAGKGDVPIKIILPSDLDAHYRVIDKGVGISPDRMARIFVNYAASTKRDSNLQTGGFGLGAKTPFSYADSFMVETIYNGVKYLWNAVIDETKCGKILLMAKINTDEPNGTEIRIPVFEKDFVDFRDRTEKATRFWDVQPEVVGYGYKSNRPEKEKAIMSGEGWELHRSDNFCRDKITVVVDGIQYDVDENVIYTTRSRHSDKPGIDMLLNGSKHTIAFFNNGILKMNANREAVAWDDETRKIVTDRLVEIAAEIHDRFQADINSASTYVDACRKAVDFTKAFGLHLSDEKVKWNGVPIRTSFSSRYGEMHWTDYYVSANAKKYGGSNALNSVKRSRSSGYNLFDGKLLVINDVGIQNLSVKRAAEIFDLLPEITHFTVVSEKSWESPEVFKEYQEYFPHLHLSKVTGKVTEKKVRKPRRTLYVWNSSMRKMERSSVDVWENETRKRIFVLCSKAEYENAYNVYLSSVRNPDQILNYLVQHHDVRVFAFDKELFENDPSSFEAFTDEAEPAVNFITREIFEKMDLQNLYEASRIDAGSEHMRYRDGLEEILKHVNNKPLFETYLALAKKSEQKNDLFNIFSSLIRIVYEEQVKTWDDRKADREIKDAYLAVMKRYPMIPLAINSVSEYNKQRAKIVAEYCNLVDVTNAVTATPVVLVDD